MDDLTGKISEILNDPQAMEQVNALAGMLGMSGNAPRREPLPQRNRRRQQPPLAPWETWGPWEACSGTIPPPPHRPWITTWPKP